MAKHTPAQQRELNRRIGVAKDLLKKSPSKPGSEGRADLVRRMDRLINEPLPAEK
ncbi:hypothetical protein OH802_09715 [Nocardioides sp. NBC_00850]|uniref:hypothetical protein n=1 Tax=Nocardioides sp. NBC_00850 TaxID=2976001 RepID=UPI00386BCC72|nr:hypothetical protein OH802_09715 [Nocardioides sp. NBC_00850]